MPGAWEGYKFILTPKWEELIDPMTWIWAMGQAFFSLSVTGSGMIVYGAYLSKEENVIGVARHTALFDTIAAVVAALAHHSGLLCLRYGCRRRSGPVVRDLAAILQDVPMGQLFAIILYAAMIFAGVQLAAEHV